MLRATILRPLNDATAIESRYEAVAEAHRDLMKREEIRRRAFSGILDLGAAAGAGSKSRFCRAARCSCVGR